MVGIWIIQAAVETAVEIGLTLGTAVAKPRPSHALKRGFASMAFFLSRRRCHAKNMHQSDKICNMQPLGIYVHIPFCQSKCPYCDFYSLAGAKNLVHDYTKALREEISYFSSNIRDHYNVATIFFGGGTPSFIPPGEIAAILECIQNKFHVDQNAEITLEMNPGSCDTAHLKRYHAMGINRISVGIQSFDDTLLRTLGRIHSVKDAHAAVRAARQAGFDNFNLDLIFAIPGQTLEQWHDTLSRALAYEPPHLCTYNLTYESNTALSLQRDQGRIKPVPEEMEIKMYQHAIQTITRLGLDHYEISNFARPSRECAHNLAYWSARDYLGLGAGAHSFLDGKRFSKKRDVGHYIGATSSAKIQIEPDDDLSPSGRFWETLAVGLRNLRGVNSVLLAARWGLHPEDIDTGKWKEWIRRRYLAAEENVLKLTPKGILYYDQIAAALIEEAPVPAKKASTAPRR